MDWEAIARDLHEQLAARGLRTWADVERQRDGLKGAVLSALHRRLVELYKTESKE